MKHILDFLFMMLAGVNFVGGLYLAFIKKFLAISIILLVIAFAIAAMISVYDIELEIKKEAKNVKKNRKNY